MEIYNIEKEKECNTIIKAKTKFRINLHVHPIQGDMKRIFRENYKNKERAHHIQSYTFSDEYLFQKTVRNITKAVKKHKKIHVYVKPVCHDMFMYMFSEIERKIGNDITLGCVLYKNITLDEYCLKVNNSRMKNYNIYSKFNYKNLQ